MKGVEPAAPVRRVRTHMRTGANGVATTVVFLSADGSIIEANSCENIGDSEIDAITENAMSAAVGNMSTCENALGADGDDHDLDSHRTLTLIDELSGRATRTLCS